MRILAIDPGNIDSGYVLMDEEYYPLQFGKVDNFHLREIIMEQETLNGLRRGREGELITVIEMIASYGMAVGATVFDTCVWIGRFTELANKVEYIYRKEEKMNLCGNPRAKDANIRQALIDRFAQHDFKNGKGTKSSPDWFYGFKSDIWAAYAVGTTYLDKLKRGEINE